MSGINQVSDDFVNELKILACFDPANMSLGIKLRSDMSEELCLAAQRLPSSLTRQPACGSYHAGDRSVKVATFTLPRMTRIAERTVLLATTVAR